MNKLEYLKHWLLARFFIWFSPPYKGKTKGLWLWFAARAYGHGDWLTAYRYFKSDLKAVKNYFEAAPTAP